MDPQAETKPEDGPGTWPETGRTFVLIPGAGGMAWYWHRVVPLLREAGHEAIAVDLPGDDEAAGLPEYAGLVAGAIGGRDDVVLVAQSLGGFTAPLAAAVPVRLVFVNAMIPAPVRRPRLVGEHRLGGCAGRRGASGAATAPSSILASTSFTMSRRRSPRPASRTSGPRPTWCSGRSATSRMAGLPVRAVAGSDDRFFPVDFQQGVARDRLGIEADVLPGGHLITLSQPAPLARYLIERLTGTPGRR